MVPKYSANMFSSVPWGKLQTYTDPFEAILLQLHESEANKQLQTL